MLAGWFIINTLETSELFQAWDTWAVKAANCTPRELNGVKGAVNQEAGCSSVGTVPLTDRSSCGCIITLSVSLSSLFLPSELCWSAVDYRGRMCNICKLKRQKVWEKKVIWEHFTALSLDSFLLCITFFLTLVCICFFSPVHYVLLCLFSFCVSTRPSSFRRWYVAGWPGSGTSGHSKPSFTCSAASAACEPSENSRNSRSRHVRWNTSRNSTLAWRTRSCNCSAG